MYCKVGAKDTTRDHEIQGLQGIYVTYSGGHETSQEGFEYEIYVAQVPENTRLIRLSDCHQRIEVDKNTKTKRIGILLQRHLHKMT